MKSKLKIAVVALTLGTAAVATAQAQTRAQTFADQFQQMQALSSTSPYAFDAAPTLTAQAAAPASRESFAERFAEMQAESSNSGEFPMPGADAANGGLAATTPIGGAHVQASR